jgi:hypothetical protein
MSNESGVVGRNPKSQQDWTEFWRIAIQLSPFTCDIQNDHQPLSIWQRVAPSVFFPAARSSRVRLDMMWDAKPCT